MSLSVDITDGFPIKEYMQEQFDSLGSSPIKLEPLPEDLQLWLGRLRLLYGVPFEYIVPEERMLPKESIRFFYLDRNWLDRLVDGALSIGKVATRDFLHHEQKIGVLRQAMDEAEVTTRSVLRGGKNIDLESFEVGGTMTGVLIRSTVVRDYPGLEVRAYSVDSDDNEGLDQYKLPLLRMDRLGPDIMLCIFQGVPKHLEVEEPREGIQSGVEETNGTSFISLRNPDGSYLGVAKGEKPDPKAKVNIKFVEGKKRVVDVFQLSQDLANQGVAEGKSSSDLALQLLQFPYLQMFDGDGKCSNGQKLKPAAAFQNPMTFNMMSVNQEGLREIKRDFKEELEDKVQTVLSDLSLNPIFD